LRRRRDLRHRLRAAPRRPDRDHPRARQGRVAAHHGGARGEARTALQARQRLGVDLTPAVAARETALAADGYPLAAARFPAAGRAWATMLVAPAMGVRQEFYEPVARFFARNGVHVLTFDYRGMGASRRGSLRAFDADVVDWAAKDFDAMLAEAQRAD